MTLKDLRVLQLLSKYKAAWEAMTNKCFGKLKTQRSTAAPSLHSQLPESCRAFKSNDVFHPQLAHTDVSLDCNFGPRVMTRHKPRPHYSAHILRSVMMKSNLKSECKPIRYNLHRNITKFVRRISLNERRFSLSNSLPLHLDLFRICSNMRRSGRAVSRHPVGSGLQDIGGKCSQFIQNTEQDTEQDNICKTMLIIDRM